MKKIQPVILASICTITCALTSTLAVSQTTENNSTYPKTVTSDTSTAYQQAQKPKAYSIGAGSLTQTLNRFAQQTGVELVFNPDLTEGKTSIGLNGQFTTQTGFAQILKGTGLEAANNANGGYTIKKTPPPVVVKEKIPNLGAKPEDKELNLDKIQVRAKRFHEIGPLRGLALTKEEIPGNVQSITGKQIKDAHAVSIADLLNSQLQSVNVNDYQGNPFQMDVIYRGFTASPQIGTAQGLSVFLDGIRVNEPFGDVVNWDMIPMNALSSFDVFPGSNPIFGLGTLGGAFSTKTKNGFDNAGVEAEVLAGSYGRKQFLMSAGQNNGVIGGFLALNLFDEDGWRKNSPSKVNQIFGKATYRTESLDLNFSTLIASNDLVGNGLVPSQLSNKDYSAVYTSPDESKNKLLQFQLSGLWDVSDTFNVTAQVYRRDSKRKASNGDVYTPDSQDAGVKTRQLAAGETPTCVMQDTGNKGYADYYVDVQDWNGSDFDAFASTYADGTTTFGETMRNDAAYNNNDPLWIPDFTPIAASFNQTLDKPFEDFLKSRWADQVNGGKQQASGFPPQIDAISPEVISPNGTPEGYKQAKYYFAYDVQNSNRDYIGGNAYYISDDGLKRYVIHNKPSLTPTCIATEGGYTVYGPGGVLEGGGLYVKTRSLYALNYDSNGVLTPTNVIYRDGAAQPQDGATTYGNGAGVIEGTPTAIISNTQIDQITDGGAVQLNWNTEYHKLMVGASIDKSRAKFKSEQLLGLLDANHNAYLDPANLGPEFAASSQGFPANSFEGSSTTKSVYFSETWSPVKSWHFTGAARYNATRVDNTLAVRARAASSLSTFNNPVQVVVLQPTGTVYQQGYTKPNPNLLKGSESEKFDYYSLNPSLGATWQATENLNLFANIGKGTRTPSVVELGCAYDHKLYPTGATNPDGSAELKERKLDLQRVCNLPSTLSGDPYLPQIHSTSIDIGARGKWGNYITWNLGAFRTDLKDDIYFVSAGPETSFFDTIGKTRRQGLEAGIMGEIGKAKLRLNYSLTDATFQSTFNILSPDNSSAFVSAVNEASFGKIQVNPGNRMPGVPLHNLNASLDYDITPDWQMGITAVMHSGSYVRGNENNKHQQGVSVFRNYKLVDVLQPDGTYKREAVGNLSPPTSNPGTVPGYAVFNFHTSYKLDKGVTLGLNIANLFDRKYYSAGRLGVNPFSPSTNYNGTIGISGYNHNSNNWLSTNFLAPGAPRGIWATLNYEFQPDKKAYRSENEGTPVDLPLPSSPVAR